MDSVSLHPLIIICIERIAIQRSDRPSRPQGTRCRRAAVAPGHLRLKVHLVGRRPIVRLSILTTPLSCCLVRPLHLNTQHGQGHGHDGSGHASTVVRARMRLEKQKLQGRTIQYTNDCKEARHCIFQFSQGGQSESLASCHSSGSKWLR